MLARLRQPALRARMWDEILEKGSELGGSTKTVLMQQGRWERLWLGNCSVNARLTGKSFGEIARIRDTEPFEAVCDILVEEQGLASFYGQDKSEADIDALARDDACGLGSDGLAMAVDGPLAQEREHPRCYGGMAYLIRTLVRERGALPLPHLVQKITDFPARRMGLNDRGRLAPGMRADVVLFDPDHIADRATLADPCAYAGGVRWLFVNGTRVLSEGTYTGNRPGQVLKGAGATR
jgi:N-acyl-D-amino-acid deacylase